MSGRCNTGLHVFPMTVGLQLFVPNATLCSSRHNRLDNFVAVLCNVGDSTANHRQVLAINVHNILVFELYPRELWCSRAQVLDATDSDELETVAHLLILAEYFEAVHCIPFGIRVLKITWCVVVWLFGVVVLKLLRFTLDILGAIHFFMFMVFSIP